MWKLLIADDEQLERRVIKSTLMKKYGANINVFEAKNGREAIEISDKEKPDVFVMDIKMPGINGIESIKEIKKIHKDAYIIILTAYDYFNFAKEAIEYNVKEYLLKPFDREVFLEKIDKAIECLQEKKTKKKKELILKEQIYNVKPMVENELSYSIISNALNLIDYTMCMECLDINFKLGYAMIIKVNKKYDYATMNYAEKKVLKNDIAEFIKELVNRYYKALVNGSFTENIVLFIQNNSEDDYSVRIDSINSGRKIRKEVKEKFGVSLSIGIGKQYRGIDNLIQSYEEAYVSLNHTIPDVNVKHFQDISAIINEKCITNKEYNEHKSLKNNHTEYSICDLYREDQNNCKNILLKSIDYIKNNYYKDITLDKVANKFNLSPYYFSRTFKEFVGVNYSEYITEIRIEKAKQMLKDHDLSIKEICFKVGYNDPNYFSRVFKKVEKISPTEYKSNVKL